MSPEQLTGLSALLDERIIRVGVFVNPTMEQIGAYAPLLGVIQLHGEEDADFIVQIRRRFPLLRIWKAARVRTVQDIADADALPVDALVLDSYSDAAHGGTGELAPWELIAQNRPEKPFFLAGGITPENVRQAIEAVAPWGVDASSSLEIDRCKDGDRIRAMTQAVRNPLYRHTREGL